MHQHNPCQTVIIIKASLQGFKAEGMDLAGDADQALSVLLQRLRTSAETQCTPVQRNSRIFWRLAKVPWSRSRMLNWCHNLGRSSWLITNTFLQRERHHSRPVHVCNN